MSRVAEQDPLKALKSVDPTVSVFIQKSLALITEFALAHGVTGRGLAQLTGEEIRRAVEAPLKAGYATPEEGLAMLLNEEGGCADVEEAAALYRPSKPVTPSAITDRIRKGDMIAYRTGGAQLRIPRWQFKLEGGLLDGVSKALAELRKSDTYNQLTPFTFFLQPHPLTGVRTPIEALRDGGVDSVIRAAKSEAE